MHDAIPIKVLINNFASSYPFMFFPPYTARYRIPIPIHFVLKKRFPRIINYLTEYFPDIYLL